MRSRYHARTADAAYFVTSTIVAWLPVFTTAVRCDIIVEALEHCRAHKALRITAWVILDNHFHAILAAPDLPRVMADLKRHTARRIIEQLEAERCEGLLRRFEQERAAHKTESTYQVWQEGFHPQAITSDEMMQQSRAERDRLAERPARRVPPEGGINREYVHLNPVKRGLVRAPEHWRYSSAHEWDPAAIPALRCDPWR